MAKSYNEYVVKHRENVGNPAIFQGGLSYSLRQGLSALPAALGHTLDTLLGLDGLLGAKDAHLGGLFGFIFGVPCWLMGAVIGQALQVAVNTPSYLAYYLLDLPLSYVIPNFHKAMKAGFIPKDGVESRIRLAFVKILDLCGILFRMYICTPHKEMDGLFGFLFGVVPEIARQLVQRVVITFVSAIQSLTDTACHAIRAWFKKPSEDAPGSPDTPSEAPKVNITLPTQKVDMTAVLNNRINLFSVLGITYGSYQQDPTLAAKKFRELSLKYHPDKRSKLASKVENGAADEVWAKLNIAKDVLADPKSIHAKKYISFFKRNTSQFVGASAAPRPVQQFNNKWG